MDLEKYFKENQNILLALSIFLLLTFSLVNAQNYLNNVLGFLSASISYILLLVLVAPNNFKKSSSVLLAIFLSLLIFFIIVFCIWVILNIIPTFSLNMTILIVIFLILMLIPSIRLIIGR